VASPARRETKAGQFLVLGQVHWFRHPASGGFQISIQMDSRFWIHVPDPSPPTADHEFCRPLTRGGFDALISCVGCLPMLL